MRRTLTPAAAGAGLLLAAARPADACEPLIPLAMSMAGPAFIMASLTGLAIAVAVKCAAYAAFERRFRWYSAVGLMLAANVVSTIVGAIVGAVTAVPILGLLGFGVIYVITIIPAARFLDECSGRALQGWGPHRMAAGVVLLVLVSTVLFVLAQSTGGDPRTLFWAFKVLFVFAGIVISMVLTTLWEGGVIAALSGARAPRGARAGGACLFRRRGRLDLRAISGGEPKATTGPTGTQGAAMDLGIFTNVVRANLVTFAVVATIGAALMIPERLASPGWLLTALVLMGV